MSKFKNKLLAYYADEQIIVLFLSIAFISLFIYFLGSYLLPFLIAIVFAFLLHDFVLWLGRFNLRPTICVTIVTLLFLSVIFLVLFWLTPVLWKQITAFIADWPRMFSDAVSWINEVQVTNPEYFQHFQVEDVLVLLREQVGQAGQRVITFIINGLPDIIVIVVYLVLVPLIMFFLLRDWIYITTVVRDNKFVKGKMLGNIMDRMDMPIAGYIKGKFIEILVMFTVSYGLFLYFDLRYSLLLALMVGVSVVIPYVGAFVATLPIMLVALFQFGIGNSFYYLMGAYIVLQILDGNVLVPLLFSETVDMHPVIIILSILLFGGFWGIAGVFFAIPLASLIRTIIVILLERNENRSAT